MPTKKVKTNGTEIVVFEDAVIYKRGEYWQFRLWLTKERKYVRLSLNTTNLNTAKEEAKKSSVGGRILIVGNLPYNISSPLLFHLMDAASDVDEQVFMLQAEVIERMVATHGSSEYSRLSVMLQSRYILENVLDVPPEAFDPPPKVDSAIVRMTPRTDLILSDKEYQALEALVSMAFAQRRKVLRNNLASVKDKLNLSDEILSQRAQDISVADYISWACKLAHQ